ncbi:MAG: toxic anion resistance protein [Lachnospiraceae bacterium]|nr:toxic anion resistance protein [Lachnospiraceae bacterium]
MGDFTLDIPNTETIKKEVVEELQPKQNEKDVISNVVKEKSEQIMSVNLDSLTDRREIIQVFETFGADVVRQSQAKNSILQKRMGDFSKAGGESGEVAKGLEDLSIKMRDLDPSSLDFTKTGVMGKIFNPIRRYFERFKTADAEIASIVKTLDKGKGILKNDNTTLEIEQATMRDLTKQLAQKIELGTQLDAYLTNEVENAKASNVSEERIKFVEEEIIFPLKQRIMDFHQLLAVNQQGIIAMEVIRKNNLELIRAVDRAETVTVSALRVAVTVAGALYNQKIVLEKVQMLNETTNNMIMATSKMLKEQGTAIQKEAVEASISTDTLKQAFSDTLSALDDINTYKIKALPQMTKTIQDFREIAEEGERQLANMEKGKNLEF